MDRLRVSACTAIVPLLLTLTNTGSANTDWKAGFNNWPAAVAVSRATRARSKGSRLRAARTKRGCASCAAKKRTGSRASRARGPVPCHPKTYVNPRIAKNYNAAMREMRRAGITPRVTSMWRSSAKQARLHRCSLSTRCRRLNPGLYRALPAGKSIHESGFAVDIAGVAKGPRGAKRITPRGRRIVAIMKRHGFNWRYGLADPVHFEADPRRYGYRSVKEAIRRTQNSCQVTLAKAKVRKKPSNRIATRSSGRSRVARAGSSGKPRRSAARSTA